MRLTEAMAGTQTRHLAAIMFTDVAGYTALMQRDEETARSYRDRHRRVLEEAVPRRGGDLLEHYGDGSLSIFGSAIEAVACALEIQRDLAAEPGVPLRIGIHTGDIVREAQGVYGDGVNVASRVQGLCPPGEVLVSERVYDDLKNQSGMFVRSLGHFELKNVTRPLEIFFVANEDRPVPVLEQNPLATGKGAMTVEAASEQKSIAVLPFINMSADPDNAFFADGITEEIINLLTRVHGLRVTARTSSFAFKGKEVDVREVGSKLNVAHVLEGSVRKSGDRVRITAQLVDTQSGYHVFSDVYDRVIEDIFETQDEIALKIMEKLQASLPGDADSERLAPGRTKDPHAYSLYLRARFFLGQWSVHGAERAVEYFKQALELDPDFPAAYGGLARAYTGLVGLGQMDREEGIALAREAARKELELDPEGVEGNLAMAGIQFFIDWDFEGAGAFFERAAAENPGFAQVHHDYSFLLRAQNRLDEAISELRAAVELDPLSLPYNNALANAYTAAGRYDDAEAQFAQILEIDPGFEPSLEGQGWLYLHRGDLAQAVDSFEALRRKAPKRETAVGALGFA
ncbi:MAG: tetratricopeptide repeat protein, partial [Gemmatimonadetes bacterium]|nr:tetratricopeptide repeat protein [Gemmatimonadota bacterium]